MDQNKYFFTEYLEATSIRSRSSTNIDTPVLYRF